MILSPRPDKMYYVPVIDGIMNFLLKGKTFKEANDKALEEVQGFYTIETFWRSEI